MQSFSLSTYAVIKYASLSFFCSLAITSQPSLAQSPLNGTWYNSYCSRMDVNIDPVSGKISGEYTSHTGSAGTSPLAGYVDPNAEAPILPATNPIGIPVSIGIYWRLVNVDISQGDNSWHWVSAYAGQYHPEQTVSVPGQLNYQIPETIEILNGLFATSTVSGLNDDAPLLWPQTLHFTRAAEAYCESVSPAPPVTYTPTAADNVSGVWLSEDSTITLTLSASLETGIVSGTAQYGSNKMEVLGVFDTIVPELVSTVPRQGLAMALYNDQTKSLVNMTGGVFYEDLNLMELWVGDLTQTDWSGRYMQQALVKRLFTRLSN